MMARNGYEADRQRARGAGKSAPALSTAFA